MKIKILYSLFFLANKISIIKGYQPPMLREYKRLPEILHYADKNKRFKLGTAIIAAHGITDIVTKSPPTLAMGYLSAYTLLKVSPIDLRYIWLVLGSTYHFSKDLLGPYSILQSLCLHELFLQKPKWVYYYLLFIHTPLHYWRFCLIPGNIYMLPVCMIFTYLLYKIPFSMFNSMCLFPVIGHIMVN